MFGEKLIKQENRELPSWAVIATSLGEATRILSENSEVKVVSVGPGPEPDPVFEIIAENSELEHVCGKAFASLGDWLASKQGGRTSLGLVDFFLSRKHDLLEIERRTKKQWIVALFERTTEREIREDISNIEKWRTEIEMALPHIQRSFENIQRAFSDSYTIGRGAYLKTKHSRAGDWHRDASDRKTSDELAVVDTILGPSTQFAERGGKRSFIFPDRSTVIFRQGREHGAWHRSPPGKRVGSLYRLIKKGLSDT